MIAKEKQEEGNTQLKYYNCSNYPTDKIIRIDDDYCSQSGYCQMHDLQFICPAPDYGTKQQKTNYKITKQISKYFSKRFFYFSRFNQGIQLDTESWYSVVAQPISLYLCERLKYYGVKTLLEPFCGVGGISVHAAGNFQHFVVNDIDENKIKMLKNNLLVYGKGLNLLTFMNKDALQIQPYKVDAVLIFPPWGGPNIFEYSYRDFDEIMNPKLSDILNHFKKFSQNIVLQMPKNTNLQNLIKVINLCFFPPIIKVQKIIVNGKISQLFIYMGDIKFTAFSTKIYEQIIKDAKRDLKNMKQLKKDLKQKLKQQKFEIFSQIYLNYQPNTNHHIFFDTLSLNN